MLESASPVEMSIVIPVGRRQADMAELYSEYSAGLDKVGASYEMIFVLDGPQPAQVVLVRDAPYSGQVSVGGRADRCDLHRTQIARAEAGSARHRRIRPRRRADRAGKRGRPRC